MAQRPPSPGPMQAATPAWLDLAMRMPLRGADGAFTLDVALALGRGELVAIAGPSGAGKTTLLRLVAGLERPLEGRLRVGAETWCDAASRSERPTRRRSIGMVFQDYALFPNMTVRGNVEYAIGRRPDAAWVDELLATVRLDRLQDQSPERLSGGQRQRLALIRALARRPAVLLLDEPLSALDPALRRELQDELLRLHRRFATTTLLVSHDPAEIVRLADRVVRLEAGRVVGDAPPWIAFGGDPGERGVCIVAEHVDGPDAHGRARVLAGGRLAEVRYRDPPAGVGGTVLLHADEVTVRRLG